MDSIRLSMGHSILHTGETMQLPTVQRIVLAASYIALAFMIATLVILAFTWSGRSGAFLAVAATVVMIATLALQAVFLIVLQFPNGRAMVATPLLGPDALTALIVMTSVPGVVWPTLRVLAGPPMNLIMPGFFTPAVMGLMLLIARQRQLTHLRAVHE